MTKTSWKIAVLLLAVATFMPFAARAFSVKTDDIVTIKAGETVDGNLYAAGANIVVDGEVKGDLICAGQSVVVNGQVDGDVLCAAQSINLLGPVNGNVRVIGSNLNFDNRIGRNVMAFGSTAVVGAKTEIGSDMLTAVGLLTVNGAIKGNLHGLASLAAINGRVDRDVSLTLDESRSGKNLTPSSGLIVNDGAQIGGNLDYTSALTATIVKSDSIGGKINHSLPDQTARGRMLIGLAFVWLWCKVIGLLGALLIGLVLVLCFRNRLVEWLDKLIVKPAQTIGWGAVILIVTPIVAVFLALTMVGLPLAALVALVFFAGLLLGKVLIAIFAGLLIMGRYRHKRAKNGAKTETVGSLLLAMIVGVVITSALFTIPLVGWILEIMARMWGLGFIWLSAKRTWFK